MSKTFIPSDELGHQSEPGPSHRPTERFWPYAELSEQPGEDELASLDPSLRTALFGSAVLPFSVTLVFPCFRGKEYDLALKISKESSEYQEFGHGDSLRHSARFFPSDVVKLRDLFEIISQVQSCEVLIDDRPVPYARELWLPLMWFLIPRPVEGKSEFQKFTDLVKRKLKKMRGR